MFDFVKPNIIKISATGDHMSADAKGHAAILYPDFGVMFAVGAKGFGEYMDFDAAEKRCADLQHAGTDGWIIAPDVRLQLLTIDYGRHEPAADPDLYPDALSKWYWTAHACDWAKDDDGAPRAFWQVDGDFGYVGCDLRDGYGVVRPCRVVGRPGQ